MTRSGSTINAGKRFRTLPALILCNAVFWAVVAFALWRAFLASH
jgi:hypothetical protein